MLEWLSSKFALFIAAFIMLSCAVGFFVVQHQNMTAQELQNVADMIADNVNAVSAAQGDITLKLAFTDEGSDVRLPASVSGKAYDIELTMDGVVVRQGDVRCLSVFIKSAHIWHPGELTEASSDQLRLMDATLPSLTLSSTTRDALMLATRHIYTDRFEYHTFVYLERAEQLQQCASELAERFDELADVNLTSMDIEALNHRTDHTAPCTLRFSEGIFVMELEQANLRVGHLISIDHLWAPERHGAPPINDEPWRVALAHLNATDENASDELYLAKGTTLYIERRWLELTDVQIEASGGEPDEVGYVPVYLNKHVLRTFVYV